MRKFESALTARPLKLLPELRGWSRTHTVIEYYQHPDPEHLREELETRPRVVGGREQREQ